MNFIPKPSIVSSPILFLKFGYCHLIVKVFIGYVSGYRWDRYDWLTFDIKHQLLQIKMYNLP